MRDDSISAPPKGNTFFPVSHISFCYSDKVPISGTVYNDLTQAEHARPARPPSPGSRAGP